MKKRNNTDKLTDKAFSRMMLISILGIVISVLSLCSVTWAWFSQEITSTSNTIKAGYYEANIAVSSVTYSVMAVDDGEPVTVRSESFIAADMSEHGFYKYTFDANSPYEVRIPYSGNGANGYCKIYVEGLETPVYANIKSVDGEFDFTVMLSKTATVRFELRWGTYSGADAVVDGGSLDITVSDGENDKSNTEETSVPAESTAELEENTPAVEENTPAAEENTPAVEENTPAAEENTPAVEENTPAVEENTPAVEENTPAAEENTPAVEENTPESIE